MKSLVGLGRCGSKTDRKRTVKAVAGRDNDVKLPGEVEVLPSRSKGASFQFALGDSSDCVEEKEKERDIVGEVETIDSSA